METVNTECPSLPYYDSSPSDVILVGLRNAQKAGKGTVLGVCLWGCIQKRWEYWVMNRAGKTCPFCVHTFLPAGGSWRSKKVILLWALRYNVLLLIDIRAAGSPTFGLQNHCKNPLGSRIFSFWIDGYAIFSDFDFEINNSTPESPLTGGLCLPSLIPPASFSSKFLLLYPIHLHIDFALSLENRDWYTNHLHFLFHTAADVMRNYCVRFPSRIQLPWRQHFCDFSSSYYGFQYLQPNLIWQVLVQNVMNEHVPMVFQFLLPICIHLLL